MSIKTWEKRIQEYNAGSPIPNSIVNALVSVFRRPLMVAARPEAAMLEESALYEYGSGPGWQITPEQTAKGLEWMRRRNVVRYWNDKEADILANFHHFTFEGVWLDWNGLRVDAAPVYRVHATDGRYFDYTCTPWQQGTKTPFRILSA